MAVNDVISATRLSQGDVARAIDPDRQESERVSLVRFLNGTRNPSRESARRINVAVAQITGHPYLAAYLVFEFESIEPISHASIKEAQRCIRWFSHFFKPGALAALFSDLDTLDPKEKRSLLMRLRRTLRRLAVSDVLPMQQKIGFTDIMDAFVKAGLDLHEKLSDSYANYLAWENLEFVVRRELGYLPLAQQAAAKRRIFDALVDPAVLSAIKVERDGKMQELITVEDGKRVSRFF